MSIHLLHGISNVMVDRILTVQDSEPVSKAVSCIIGYNVGSVLVMDERGKLVGIITKGDILKKVVLRGSNPLKTPSKTVMSFPVVTILYDATVDEASRLMTEKKISKLPVVDAKGKLVGIVTSTDILRTQSTGASYHQGMR